MPNNSKPLSKRFLGLPDAAIIAMAQAARDLQAQGRDIVNLTIGQPDFDTPGFIKQAAKRALDDGQTKYTPVPGNLELRAAIAKKFKTENNIAYQPDGIVVSNGAKQSIATVCLALLDPGDEVIIPSPYWTSYLGLVALAGAKAIICPASVEEGFKLPAGRLEAAITPKTKLIILNSPSNPTGAIYTHDELAAIADIMAAHDHLHVVSDEIYEYINFTGQHVSLASFDRAYERTITVNGFSKGFAMTGWRLGYIGAPAWLARACSKIQVNVTSGANSFAQAAAIEALAGDRGPTNDMVATYRQRRELVVKRLEAMPGIKISAPDGSFYAFPDISGFLDNKTAGNTINNSVQFCNYLLEQHGLSLVPGQAFGDDKCVRLSFAASRTQITKGLDRLEDALTALGSRP